MVRKSKKLPRHLIVYRTSAMGDVAMLAHALRALKRAYPDLQVTVATRPLFRAFFTPHVHSRLRKRLSRCTLDCGFKTLESPALRGFEVGPRALATAALYLVPLSNG